MVVNGFEGNLAQVPSILVGIDTTKDDLASDGNLWLPLRAELEAKESAVGIPLVVDVIDDRVVFERPLRLAKLSSAITKPHDTEPDPLRISSHTELLRLDRTRRYRYFIRKIGNIDSA